MVRIFKQNYVQNCSSKIFCLAILAGVGSDRIWDQGNL